MAKLAVEGCHCDPPESGEEYCTGHCLLSAEIARLEKLLTDADWRELAEKRKVEALLKHNNSLMTDVARLKKALDISHQHAYLKPGCGACQILFGSES